MVRLLCLVLVCWLPAGAVDAFKPHRETGHAGITNRALRVLTARAGEETLRFSEDALKQILAANASVDGFTTGLMDPDNHFDDEHFPGGSRRLLDLKNQAIDELRRPSPDGDRARELIGHALHTLQDFYSHSNWVELGNIEPYALLGTFAPVVATDPRPACTEASIFPFPHGGDEYIGPGQIELTSAYFRFPSATGLFLGGLLQGKRELCTPSVESKCVHGIPISCSNGINKDTNERLFHDVAYSVAIRATSAYVQSILDAEGVKGNGVALRALMNPPPAMVFVIDESLSMATELPAIKSKVIELVNAVIATEREPDTWVLVRFSKRSSPEIFGSRATIFNFAGGDRLHRISTVNASFGLVGSFGLPDFGGDVTIAGLALDRETGTLFGAGAVFQRETTRTFLTQIYTIDRQTGLATLQLSEEVGTGGHGIAYDSNRKRLFVTDQFDSNFGGTSLYTWRPGAGSLTRVGTISVAFTHVPGLAYDAATDTLFGLGSTSSGTSHLIDINPLTGFATPRAHALRIGSWEGLAFDPESRQLYATRLGRFVSGDRSELYRIDPETGEETRIGTTEGSIQGLAIPDGFGESQTILRTDDFSLFVITVNTLTASGDFDTGEGCPALSLEAVDSAISASPSTSVIHVFTDSTSRNPGLAGVVIRNARAKGIRVFFHVTGSCSPIDPVFQQIASATDGEVLQLSEDEPDATFLSIEQEALAEQAAVVSIDGPGGTEARSFDVPIDSTVESLSVSFSSLGDDRADVFRVAAGSGDVLLGSLVAASAGSALNPVLEVIDSAGVTIFSSGPSSFPSDVDFAVPLPDAGPHFVRVTDADSGSGSDHFYTLELRRALPVSEIEPNDDAAGAMPVTPPAVVTGILDDLSDWFRLSGNAGQRLIAEVRADRDGSSLDSILYLYDSNGSTLLAENDDFEDLDSRIDVRLPATGEYVLQLVDFSDDFGPDFFYTLTLQTVDVGPSVTENESNDTTASANPVGLPSSVSGALDTPALTGPPFTLFRPGGAPVSGSDADTREATPARGRVLVVDGPVPGHWRIDLPQQVASGFSLRAQVETPILPGVFELVGFSGRPAHEGLFPIAGAPLLDEPQIGRATLSGPFATLAFSMLDAETGAELGSLDLVLGDEEAVDGEYVGPVPLPDRPFRVAVAGEDTSGRTYRRVYHGRIEPVSVRVELVIGGNTLPAGVTTPYVFEVENRGGPAVFDVSASAGVFAVGRVEPTPLTLGSGETARVEVDLILPEDVEEGALVVLTVAVAEVDDPSNSNTARFVMTARTSNEPPFAHDAATFTTADHSVAVLLTGEDADLEPLAFSVTKPPANGVLSGTPPLLSYLPTAGFTGSDFFEFTVEDPFVTSAPATLSIEVQRQGDLDGDGDVDRDDLDILISFNGNAVEVGDILDFDADGAVTVLDSRKLLLLCDLPRCELVDPTQSLADATATAPLSAESEGAPVAIPVLSDLGIGLAAALLLVRLAQIGCSRKLL